MFKLKMATDPRWVDIAEKNIEEILTDHAFCEQKAASYAISLLIQFPDYPELVDAMTDLALEEMSHFKMVINELKKRNLKLGWERKDPYVRDLQKFFSQGCNRERGLINKLLTAGMIEARSCERFRILSENIADKDLSDFYFKLMKSEAQHYTMFLKFAKKYGAEIVDVEQLWEEFLQYEGSVIQNYGKKEHIHG